LQRRLVGAPADFSDRLSQLLLRFFHWRSDRARQKPSGTRSVAEETVADEPRFPDDNGDRAEEVADEPFLEPGELIHGSGTNY
jgi:hypothetical protein